MAIKSLDEKLQEINMVPVADLTDTRSAWTWETGAGMDGGILIVGHIDVPFEPAIPKQGFRREPEWLSGEGIAMSRAPLVMVLTALRALRHVRALRKLPLGVLYYLDEGRDCRYSVDLIRSAASRAKKVLVVQPGNLPASICTQRRGQRKFQLVVEGPSHRIGQQRGYEAVGWCIGKLEDIIKLSSRKDRLTVAVHDLKTEAFRTTMPYRITASIVISYIDPKMADGVEEKMNEMLTQKGVRWSFKQISDRPSLKQRRGNIQLARAFERVAKKWEIPLETKTSLLPSPAGLVPARVPVVCGLGPAAKDRYTPQEAVSRISLIQRTLLLSQYLVEELDK
jgi:D-alanine-D-alanine ligase